MAQRISTVTGVAQVQVFGPQKYAVRVQLDPPPARRRGIGIDEVADAVRAANVNLPTGTLYGPRPVLHRPGQRPAPEGRRLSARDRRLPQRLAGPPRRPRRTSSTASRTTRPPPGTTTSARSSLAIFNASRAPTPSRWSTRSRRCSRPSRRSCRPRRHLHVLYDRSASIRDSVDDVKFTLLLTLVLVVLVIFLFLRNALGDGHPEPRAAVLDRRHLRRDVSSLGYSLDNLSLMALTLSVGFVVDDAIVMLENIVRHMEMGEGADARPRSNGSREIGFTIISMTLSLAAVFIPVLFMGGIVGRLFHEFAVDDRRRDPGLRLRVADADADALQPLPEARSASRSTAGSIKRDRARSSTPCSASTTGRSGRRCATRAGSLAMSVLVLVATGCLFVTIPKGFLPSEDQGQVFGSTRGGAGHRLRRRWREHQQQIGGHRAGRPRRRRRPDLGGTARRARPSATPASCSSQLKPRGERGSRPTRSSQELRPKLAQVPGIRAFLQNPAADPPRRAARRRASTSSRCRTRTRRSSTSTPPLLEGKIRELAGLQDVTSDLQLTNPQLNVDDRPRHARPRSASRRSRSKTPSTPPTARARSRRSTRPNNQYQVILELAPEFQAAPGGARPALRARRRPATSCRFRRVASRHARNVGPLTVNHPGQLPAGHDLVQPAAGRRARRRRGGGQPGGAPDAARDRAARASRARRRRSRAPSRASGCCSSSRSSSSTSCSASCTRASSTR